MRKLPCFVWEDNASQTTSRCMERDHQEKIRTVSSLEEFSKDRGAPNCTICDLAKAGHMSLEESKAKFEVNFHGVRVA